MRAALRVGPLRCFGCALRGRDRRVSRRRAARSPRGSHAAEVPVAAHPRANGAASGGCLMRRRLACLLPSLLSLLLATPGILVAEDGKEKKTKAESASPPFKVNYRLLSDVPEQEPNDSPAQA